VADFNHPLRKHWSRLVYDEQPLLNPAFCGLESPQNRCVK